MNSKLPSTKASEIRISNALNRASQRLNLSEKRLISLVLKAIDRPLKDDEVFSTSVKASDLMQLSGITKAAAYTELKNAEKSLWLKSIVWNWQDLEDSSQVNKSKRAWIIGVDYLSGALVTYLNPLLNKHVSHLKERFTVYDLEQVGHFKSISTWRLYELLRQERTRGMLLIKVDDFRLAMDIEPDKYKQFYDLEKRVIKPALAEIEEKNGLKVAFEKLKDGKAIKALKFSFKIEKPEAKSKTETKRTIPPDTKLSTKVASVPDDNQIKSATLSQFLGYQQRAKLLKESIEQHLKQNATEKEIKQFQEYGFIE
jgi:plasmid replication initiation protein